MCECFVECIHSEDGDSLSKELVSFLEFFFQIVKYSAYSLPSNESRQFLVLVPIVYEVVVTDIVATQPLSGIGIDIIVSDVGPSGSDPEFSTCILYAPTQYSRTVIDRHCSLHAALAIGEFDVVPYVCVYAVGRAEPFFEWLVADVVIVDSTVDVAGCKLQEVLVVLPHRAIDVYGNDRLDNLIAACAFHKRPFMQALGFEPSLPHP
ncbi:MAG TPA: hypothetical protein VH593_11960 [Ktedonobacteraceae bacterium]